MDEPDLERLLRVAPDRFDSIELTAEWNYNPRLGQIASREILGVPSADPLEPDGWWRWSLHLWGQQPCSYRVIERRRTDPGVEVTLEQAANADQRWFDARTEAALPPDVLEVLRQPRPCEGFESQLPPQLSELLDPSSLWDILDGAEATFSITISEDSFLGRDTYLLDVSYEEVEGDLWGDVLDTADRHTIWIDKQTSIMLKVACWFQGEEFSITEITHLSFDPVDPSIFQPPS